MGGIRTRRLLTGEHRYDVTYRDPATGNHSHRTFHDPETAEGFAAAVASARLTGVRWPLAPLLAATGMDRQAFARRWNINHETIDQTATEGLTDRQADHWAIRAGYHPACIWGWAWIDAGLNAGQIELPDAEAVA